MNDNQQDFVVSLAKIVGADLYSHMEDYPKPTAFYFTIEQLQDFAEHIKNQPEINLPYSLVVRYVGNSYDRHHYSWCEGYDEGYNECIREVKRLNNL
jgi:hypothetical protein